jgi:hypothetical protein
VTGQGPEVTEYALERRSGDMIVRCTAPDVERVYPLARWLEHHAGQVQTRTIIVVSDWTDLPVDVDWSDAT